MARAESTNPPSRIRKRIATAIAFVGIAVIGGQLARVWPREVDVAYRSDEDVQRLDVDVVLDGEAVASARFYRLPEDRDDFLHTVSLPPGEYEARITVYAADGRGVQHSRVIVVPSAGLTRFDLRGR
ncbi:MAG: hypothetical protein AAGF92_06870 [Myxococcota bacterium]